MPALAESSTELVLAALAALARVGVVLAPVLAALARVDVAQLAPVEVVAAVFGHLQTREEEKFQSQDRCDKYSGDQYLNTHPFHFVSVAGEDIAQERPHQCQAQPLSQN
jgi:hypothetical protein